jgi:hypothetical protein
MALRFDFECDCSHDTVATIARWWMVRNGRRSLIFIAERR